MKAMNFGPVGDFSPSVSLHNRVIREDRAHQLLGDLGEDHSRGDWRVERYRASGRVQAGEANADRHGSTRPGLGSEAGPDSICKMKQGGADDSLCGGLPTDRRLRSYRSGPSVNLDLP